MRIMKYLCRYRIYHYIKYSETINKIKNYYKYNLRIANILKTVAIKSASFTEKITK
jgi:ADP-glucose pyrophosphorylase